MKLDQIIDAKRIACPECHQVALTIRGTRTDRQVYCRQCDTEYPVLEDIPLLMPQHSRASHDKQAIQQFWKELYRASYADHQEIVTGDNLTKKLQALHHMFVRRKHLAAVEMPIDSLSGKHVLEVGSGAGAHSALFSLHGAHVTALDLTLDRVIETSRKLDLIQGRQESFALQGDSECLPFPAEYFDIVYSNGVLHHTIDTRKAIDEVWRVLKPVGKAVLMLYARESFYYWVSNFLVQGLLLGQMFKHRNWLGRATEWMPGGKRLAINPETKVFTRRELQHLLNDYRSVHIRKSAFVVQQIPLVGKYLSRLLGVNCGYDPTGNLIYDRPWRNETRFELWLGECIGFAWNIKATKPS